MTLSLPEDAERFIPSDGDFNSLHDPAVYALVLKRPENLAEAWDDRFDHRPDYMDALQNAETVCYVGQSGDVFHRLEQHDKGKFVPAPLEVCEIQGLRNIWFMDSKEDAEIEESRIAIMLQNEHPEMYVHSR